MEIQRPCHEHPLILFEDNPPPGCSIKCDGCDQPFSSTDPIYACIDCKFFLHKSCTDLTPQIHHPLHPLHPLALNLYPGFHQCNCCRRVRQIPTYCCEECWSFDLCVDCASLITTPILKLRDPSHLFLLLPKVDFSNDVKCSACNYDLGSAQSNSLVLFCIIPHCDCAIHLHCSPLRFPEEIRHQHHNFHDLVYTEDVVDYGYSEGDNYCHACEERRNPKLPVYACKESGCEFAAHVHCGVSEMLPSLVEKYENDLLERVVFLDALPRYCKTRISEARAAKEKLEAQLKEIEEKIEKLEISLRD